MAAWDPTRVKAQLRLTAQRLGQLQSTQDAEGQITRRDIATLLASGAVPLARAKALKLVRADVRSDVLETLEMHIGVALERLAELDQPGASTSPAMTEAASSIIYAAAHIESRDLQLSRDMLASRLGADFARSATGNYDKHVSPRILRGLSMHPPSAAGLDAFMANIARSAGVNWRPALLPHERLTQLSEILDPESTAPIIDLPRLRILSAPGIPSHPPWLRPRIWRLFFKTLPVLRADWASESQKQRDSYYDLTRRLLEPYDALPPPTTPPLPLDATLLNVYQQLSRVPPSLFHMLEDEPDHGELGPLSDNAPPELAIACAGALDKRLQLLQGAKHGSADGMATPEIRLEGTPEIRLEGTPEIRLAGAPEIRLHEDGGPGAPAAPTTLLAPRALAGSSAHASHTRSLLRLLLVHAALHPGARAPHVGSLLVPLYSALAHEAEPAHAEADAFWLFEAVLAEFAELTDEDEGGAWPMKLSARLAWADDELFANLNAKGLDPALPHYSYRWMAPMLAHTLPLNHVFPIWDALFSRPERTRDTNPKIEHLVDICTSMLMRARAPLFALGKTGRKSPSLWSEENASMPPPSPLRPWEAGDAFLEGMTLLQQYPIEAAGGIDGILQTAADLLSRREAEEDAAARPSLTLGARLRDTVWRGFTNQVSSPLPEIDEDGAETDSEDEVETVASVDEAAAAAKPAAVVAPVWALNIGSTVWRGITNQSAMDAPPSPVTPVSPMSRQHSLSPSPSPVASRSTSPLPDAAAGNSEGGLHPSTASRVTSLWNYAAKLKDSDTAASLAKTSSNWTAKAMGAWTATNAPAKEEAPVSSSSPPTSPVASTLGSFFKRTSTSSNGSQDAGPGLHSRTQSVSSNPRDSLREENPYSPPPKPAFFRPVRDSFLPGQTTALLPPTSPEPSPTTGEGFVSKAKHLQDSLASLTGGSTPPKAPAAGPRPLLLGGRGVVVGGGRPPPPVAAVVTPTPPHHQRQWSDAHRPPRIAQRDSQSSVSSLAPADAARRSQNWDSDSGVVTSRIVPLRRSVSPMAPTFRAPHARTESVSSSGSGGRRGWNLVDAGSPPSSAPGTPLSPPIMVPLHRPVARSSGTSSIEGMVKIAEGPQVLVEDTSESSAQEDVPLAQQRLRSKRSKPAGLRIDSQHPSGVAASPDRATLTPEPDEVVAAATPRAAMFTESTRSSPDEAESGGATGLNSGATIRRARKVSARSNSGNTGTVRRVRKVSTEGRSPRRTTARESEAEHGDDEGYDDLLSAYDSEDERKAAAAAAAAGPQ